MVQSIQKKNTSKTGALAPLFDRLVDENLSVREELHPFQTLSRQELVDSITAEISLVLNTRPTAKRLADTETTDSFSDYKLPIFFGLADFSWFEGSNDFSLHQVVRRLEEIIAHFEPRLKNPKVRVKDMDKSILGMHVDITGDIMVDDVMERYNFPVTINNLFTR